MSKVVPISSASNAQDTNNGSNDLSRHSGKNKSLTVDELKTLAIEITREKCTVFKNQIGIPYVAIPWPMKNGDPDIYEFVPIQSTKFGSWIALQVEESKGHHLSESARRTVITTMADAASRPYTPICPVYTRVAPGEEGAICIDLCDESKAIIKISGQGVGPCPQEELPLFMRQPGTAALPNPIGVTPDLGALRKYLNLPGNDGWVLVLIFLLFSLRSSGPYPILMVSGSAGSSKTTLCRILRKLIDPRTPEIQSMSRSEQDLAITASNSHLIILDNLHKVQQSMSDALCRISTGGGLRFRELYSNNSEVLFDLTRPVILNGIQSYVDQTDLLDRTIHLDLPAVKQEQRQTEEQFWSAFEQDYPAIFAGLLDALSKTLKILPRLSGESPIRMADFYFFGNAVEHALSWEDGTFHEAVIDNQSSMMADTTEDDPLAQAIIALVKKRIAFGTGAKLTAAEWLDELANYADDKIRRNAKLWPQTPHAFGKRLRLLIPALAALGIKIEFLHSGTRKIVITNNI